MEHWQVPYLGIRQIPNELNEFELNTFFTFSNKERALIDSRRNNLYRLAAPYTSVFYECPVARSTPTNKSPKHYGLIWVRN